MHLRPSEEIIRIVKRHRTPYVFFLIEMVILSVPLFFLVFYAGRFMSTTAFFIILAVVSFLLGIIITIFSVDYLLDTLTITNKRVVWINWRTIFKREEYEVELPEIQDVKTIEKGILSKVPFFDYGTLSVETAASKTSIIFKDCPDPEAIKQFILRRALENPEHIALQHRRP